MRMHNLNAGIERPVQKLRFPNRREFWSFVTHMALSRLHAYNPAWAEATLPSEPPTFIFPSGLMPPTS